MTVSRRKISAKLILFLTEIYPPIYPSMILVFLFFLSTCLFIYLPKYVHKVVSIHSGNGGLRI